MSYNVAASGRTPALVIYLIDVSGSMGEEFEGQPKYQHVNAALNGVLTKMVWRSTKGIVISPRYRAAVIAYSTEPNDLLGGIRTVAEIVQTGAPELRPAALTDTAAAFVVARDLLWRELPAMRGHPAPLVCHMTDGRYTGVDPEPIAAEIMAMRNDDGPVLIQNIFVAPNLLREPIADATTWEGVRHSAEIADPYALKLFRMSSCIPPSYAEMIQDDGYNLQAGSRLLFPASTVELIELAFAMSGATYTR
jgi:hypothetical protein